MIKNIFPRLLSLLKRTYKVMIIAVVIFLAFIFFVLPRVRAFVEGPAAKYETTKVKKGDLTQSISASGQIEAERQVDLKFQTSGQLVWVGVKEGDKVQKWQAIASLDRREIEMNIKKKLLAFMNERWDFEQSREDYEVEGIPIEERGTLTEAERRILEKAQFDLDSTVLDVEIQDLAKKLATLISPIEGLVTHLDVPLAGINITPATAVFSIADPSEMKFVANVDESDIASVKIGQKVTISLDAFLDETFSSEVNQISFAAVTTRGGGTAFPVEILLPENLEERFKVGMNGDIEIIISQVEGVLRVPSSAIMEIDGQTKIKTIEGKTIKEIEVETGIEAESETQILQGLSEGQVIITGEKKD